MDYAPGDDDPSDDDPGDDEPGDADPGDDEPGDAEPGYELCGQHTKDYQSGMITGMRKEVFVRMLRLTACDNY